MERKWKSEKERKNERGRKQIKEKMKRENIGK